VIIVDTNVLSEFMREHPDRHVYAWLDRQNPDEVFTTAITKAEVYYGIEIKVHGRKRASLQAFADRLFGSTFKGKILPFDSSAAMYFARMSASLKSRGKKMSEFDAQIAAIAHARSAILATRNTYDFEACGVELINPWPAR
jgi:predicted nucleic acid-binding protein